LLYIGFHEFKHRNNYPVTFLFIHQQSKVKLKTDIEGQTFAGIKQSTIFNKIFLFNSKYMFDKKRTYSDDPIHKILA